MNKKYYTVIIMALSCQNFWKIHHEIQISEEEKYEFVTLNQQWSHINQKVVNLNIILLYPQLVFIL